MWFDQSKKQDRERQHRPNSYTEQIIWADLPAIQNLCSISKTLVNISEASHILDPNCLGFHLQGSSI